MIINAQLKRKFLFFLGKKRNSLQENNINSQILIKNNGYCPTCAKDVTFLAKDSWFRDSYCCSNCGSIPRERALMTVIEMYFPNWRNLIIHESSPSNRGASKRLAEEATHYIPSQFFSEKNLGSIVNGIRCESLEALTFDRESIDLHITQDVLEHVFHPSKVFSEIARTLKPGGAHIFTVPIVNKEKSSEFRAKINHDNQISYIQPPIYHGNPISEKGSLVTIDWGFDICQHIFESCNLFTNIIHIDDLSKGIRAEYIEVLVTVKPKKDHTNFI